MNDKPTPCYICGEPADLLCDWSLARDAAYRLLRGRDNKTCDRPLCRGHAHRHATVHVDIQTKLGKRGEWHTIDYCPEHHQLDLDAKTKATARKED